MNIRNIKPYKKKLTIVRHNSPWSQISAWCSDPVVWESCWSCWGQPCKPWQLFENTNWGLTCIDRWRKACWCCGTLLEGIVLVCVPINTRLLLLLLLLLYFHVAGYFFSSMILESTYWSQLNQLKNSVIPPVENISLLISEKSRPLVMISATRSIMLDFMMRCAGAIYLGCLRLLRDCQEPSSYLWEKSG